MTAATRQEDPPFSITYGGSGRGKSVNQVASWAACAGFIAGPGGLRVDQHVLGIDISRQVLSAYRLSDVSDRLRQLRAAGYWAAAIDDLTVLAKNTKFELEKKFAIYKTDRNGQSELKGYDRALYGALATELRDVLVCARNLGMAIDANCHDQGPMTKEGEYFAGGPNFAWAKLVKEAPYLVDILVFAQPREPNTPDWDTRCDCDAGDGSYQMKDRFHVLPKRNGPLNTAEHLRAGGWPVPRYPGLEWMEGPVEQIAQNLLAGANEIQAREGVLADLKQRGVIGPHRNWVARDGIHRGRLRLYAQRKWEAA